MALTYQDQPTSNTFYSVGNPIEYLISSTNSGTSNFKVDIKVYYDPSGANTLIYQGKYDIIPSTTQILFDAHKVLKSKVVENITNLKASTTGLQNEILKSFAARVVAQEYFGTFPALTGSTQTSNTIRLWNGAFKYRGWQAGDVADYRINAASAADVITQKILTGFNNKVDVLHSTVVATPSNYFRGPYNVRKITSSQLAQIQWLWQASGGTANVQINTYQSDLSAGQSGTITTASPAWYMSLNIGMAALIADGSGTLDLLSSTDKYMSISIHNAAKQLSAVYLYEIDWSPCSRFESFEIHWLNRAGGWDSKIFNKRSRHFTEIEKKGYNISSLPISGSSIVHNSYDIKGRNNVITTKESYSLNSDNLQSWELQGLEDLATSPLVYWNSSDGFINIVPMMPESHEHKINTVDKLFNFGFTFEIDNQDIRQLP